MTLEQNLQTIIGSLVLQLAQAQTANSELQAKLDELQNSKPAKSE